MNAEHIAIVFQANPENAGKRRDLFANTIHFYIRKGVIVVPDGSLGMHIEVSSKEKTEKRAPSR